MAVQQYQISSGETLWKVYVNVRSKITPSLRTQRKQLGFKTQKEAEREETKLVRECERELAEKESKGSTWESVIDRWESFMAKTQSDRLNAMTREDYVASIKKHTFSWLKRQACDITKADVLEVLSQMEAFGASNSYQRKMKTILNRIFTFGIDFSLIKGMDRGPTAGIYLGRDENKKPEILTIDQIKQLLEMARQVKHPWFYVWCCALLTGMRSGELYALEWNDIDWTNKLLSVTKSYNCRLKIIKSTKSGDWRSIPISTELEMLLKELKSSTGAETYVLPRLTEWKRGGQARELRKFCVGIGLPSIKFHTLRACFATQLIRNGIPPIQIQKICGWKDLETMQRYIRLAGIEITGVTESLRVLPDMDVLNHAGGLFAA